MFSLFEFDQYEIGELIDEGIISKVFKAIDKKTGKEVAIKTGYYYYENILTNYEQMRFLNSISLYNHNLPGIVNLINFRFPLANEEKTKLNPFFYNHEGRKKNIFFKGLILIMEYMKSGNVKGLVKEYLKSKGKENTKINPTIRCKIIFGIAAIMKRIHQKNYFHFNLKLENVFLDDKLEPKISDFVISKYFTQDKDSFMQFSNFYAAPEYYVDDEVDVKKYDAYTFAFIIYNMFALKIQFNKQVKSIDQYERNIIRGQRPKRPDLISDPYWELIQKCWKQNPDERISFDEIVEELKSDKFAIEEFGMKTDLDKLHEYQNRIDIDDDEIIDVKIPKEFFRENRKTLFNWYRH